MSGGFFGYQYKIIETLAQDIEVIVAKEGWVDDEFAEGKAYDLLKEFDAPSRKIVLREMRDLVLKLQACALRVQSVEWLLSGDYGKETYLEELNKLKIQEICDDRR